MTFFIYDFLFFSKIVQTNKKQIYYEIYIRTNQRSFVKKEYQFFDRDAKLFNLNIIGIRSNNEIANSFDDWLYLIFRDDSGEMKIHEFPITTDPGAYWLKNPMNIEGTAILVPGQYSGSHAIGKHQGKYEALKQKGRVNVWRDNTKDTVLDKEGKYIQVFSELIFTVVMLMELLMLLKNGLLDAKFLKL